MQKTELMSNQFRAPLVLELADEAWFDVQFAHQDIRPALATGRSEHVPLPSAALADEWLTKATSLDYGHRDVASLPAILTETSATRHHG